jgi:type IV secretion system protein VirB2
MNKLVNNFCKYFQNMNYVQLAFTFLAITFVSIEPSLAQDFTSINTVLGALVTAITGPIGSTIAAIGIIAIGFTFLSGRMDWMFAVSIIVGIAIIFGAATFAGTFVTT